MGNKYIAQFNLFDAWEAGYPVGHSNVTMIKHDTVTGKETSHTFAVALST